MRILVTGAAGFIGSHTATQLLARDHEVIGLDSFDDYLYPASDKRDNLAEVERAASGKPWRFVEGNIHDYPLMSSLIGDSIEVVVHLAALAGVRPSLLQPQRYIETNLGGTTNILEAMREHGVSRLACASSSSVYGAKGEAGQLAHVAAFREDDPCLTPASPYAATKRAAELLCSTYRDLYGIGVANLRFFTVYGPRQRPDMAIHKFARLIASGQPITMYGDGSSRRDYTYIDDIVAGTVAAAERTTPASFATYNLGGTETNSLSDLIAAIENVVGKKAEIVKQPMQPGDVPVTYADITNAKRDLDYQPKTPLDQGLPKFWQWLAPRI